MAHSSAQTTTNNTNANSTNNNGNTTNNSINNGNKLASGVVILQRNTSQPIDIATSSNNGTFNKPSAPTVAQQLAFNKMDKKKANRNRYDKNITFSTPVDDIVLDEEFDFEKNLALFDKQAIWDKIDANQKPDLVIHLFCHIQKNFPNFHFIVNRIEFDILGATCQQKSEKLSTRREYFNSKTNGLSSDYAKRPMYRSRICD